MSRRCVGYEGPYRARTPIYVDEGPASVAVSDRVRVLGATPAAADILPTGGAGEIEITRVEVDETTRSQARAARTNPTPGFHGVKAPLDHMQASRMNGAARRVEVMAARRATVAPTPSPEEETVSEAAPNGSTNIPEIIPERAPNPLSVLADAAEKAALARDEHEMAQTAWDEALAALVAAWGNAGVVVEAVVPAALVDALDEAVQELEAVPTQPDKLTSTDDVNPTPIGGGPAPRRNVREPRTEGLTTRQAKAIELMQGGKTRAEIARAMGTTYQTVDGLLEAAARKKLLPIELIPLLPARFAKYTSV